MTEPSQTTTDGDAVPTAPEPAHTYRFDTMTITPPSSDGPTAAQHIRLAAVGFALDWARINGITDLPQSELLFNADELAGWITEGSDDPEWATTSDQEENAS